MKITIFYSWQTSTDTKYNKNFILTCIEKAVKILERKPEFQGVDFVVLEGIRGEPGSSPVASTITDERIPNSDIFIADLSVTNQLSNISKFIQRIFDKRKFRPYQNNNVINEHGVASNAIGTNRIIGVLNRAYGSPKNNPENIPFDLRHLRFPIEYKYCKKTRDVDNVKKELVDDLFNALKNTALYALSHQKEKYYPFKVWSSWEKIIKPSPRFFRNKKIEEITEIILSNVKASHCNIRLLGLSGLGKTRIVLEAFRVKSDDEESIVLSSRVIYLDYNLYIGIDVQHLLNNFEKGNEDLIVIIDNCPILLHRQILPFCKNTVNNISLITINSTPEEMEQDQITGVEYIVIKKDELKSIVDEIIETDFQMLDPESKEKIKDFSQGIPMMAVLLGESVRNGERFIGKLTDKYLLDNLLGSQGKETRSRIIMKTCSLFNYFGYEEELSSQLNFIATDKNITSLDGDNNVIINEFNEVCQFYLKREIFERRGRLIGMRPFPLALSLALEWLEICTPERLTKVIESIAALKEPDRTQLSEAFAEQMKYLGYSEKAVLVIEKIVGPGSPFDNAEVLNTELGSRLFRSFVEVNPEAVAKNISRNLANKSKDDLLNFEEGRRNLVWTLEKLCFDKRTFTAGAKIMFALAIAENESWSNNATGQFLKLFKIILSGTEANLEERWKIIEWGLSNPDVEYQELAIRAMSAGLSYGYFTRVRGPERQGTKKLMDHYPSGSELEDYWSKILNSLTSIIKSNSKISESATKVIANSIGTVFNAGYAEMILPKLSEVAEHLNYDWDEGLINLIRASKSKNNYLPEAMMKQINELRDLLTKKDFKNRYLTFESVYYNDHSGEIDTEKVRDGFIALADEFVQIDPPWEQYLELFYRNRLNFTFFFGKRLYNLLSGNPESVQSFLVSSINVLISIKRDETESTVLAGFISEASKEEKDLFYEQLTKFDELCYLTFYFISSDTEGKSFFNLLFKLIDNQKCSLQEFEYFRYSEALKVLSYDELNAMKDKLFSYGLKGYEVVFDIYFNLGYNNEEKTRFLLPIFKECIYKVGIVKKETDQLASIKWEQSIRKILENPDEKEFAVYINQAIIDSITYNNTYNIDYTAKEIYRLLLTVHFETIWPDLSQALLSEEEDYIKFYSLKNILGAQIGGISSSIGVLFMGDIDAIFKWSQNNVPLAPTRLAELVPIFGNNNDDYQSWHPISTRLINEFGNIDAVLQSISTNMGNYSWTGSIVPLLESKRILFESISNHQLLSVSEWAKKQITYLDAEIKQEKNRDAEMYL
ncbi:MAG TPA: hypothetical protein PLM34_00030 [Lentimicrobium sp.]|nr:hypothetical protein [Lentimicrobium sp.]